MRLVQARKLAVTLGIPIRTMSDVCRADPNLAVKKDGVYFIDLEELANRPGFDLVSALMLPSQKWIRAVDVARIAGKSRRTVNHWCRVRPRFATRIGRTWYINLEELGATPDQIETLKKYVPNQKTTIEFVEALSVVGNNVTKEDRNDKAGTEEAREGS